MKSRRPVVLFASAAALSLGASLLFSACAGSPTCHDYGNCPETGGSGGNAIGGSAGNAGLADNAGGGALSGSGGSGDGVGGSSGANAGTGTGVGGASGAAGGAGEAPCSGDCGGATPVCNPATDLCVECLTRSDCKAPKPACDTGSHACVECTATTDCNDSSKPFCDTTAQQCVACLKQADCTAATTSACNGGMCKACTVDAECSNIAGKGVCNAGTCVQCTAAKESACGGKSCDPATDQCTATPVGTVNYCQPCLADSECIGGNQPDQDARCVPMKFMGMDRPGGFCFRRVAKGCTPPFGIPISAGSLSGTPSDSYCGIDQSTTRCEAVLDLVASRNCPDGLATSCGCTRNKMGTCTDSGQGGLCKDVGAFANKCTIPCASADQCLTTGTCPGGAKPYCQ